MIPETRYLAILVNDDGSIEHQGTIETPYPRLSAGAPATSRQRHPSNCDDGERGRALGWELVLVSEPMLNARRQQFRTCLYRPVAATTDGVAGDRSEW